MLNKEITIERAGKKPQRYTLIMHLGCSTYLAVKNKDSKPKRVYLVNLVGGDTDGKTEEENT